LNPCGATYRLILIFSQGKQRMKDFQLLGSFFSDLATALG